MNCAILLGRILPLLTVGPIAAQRVWIVAPTGGTGVDFTQIQPAVDAAADGDMIVVRAGTYATFQINAKALAVCADGGTVTLTAVGALGLRIDGVRADQTVVVRGFQMRGFQSGISALQVSACQGPVLLEDCWWQGLASTFGGRGAGVSGSPRVTFARCLLDVIPSRPGNCGIGLSVYSSSVTLHQCSVYGISNPVANGAGWPGAVVTSSFLFAAGTSFVGGNGGPGFNVGTCVPPGNGGDAIQLSDAAASAVVLDCRLFPGSAGAAGTGCPPGSSGQPFGGPGSHTLLNGTAGALRADPSPVRMGQSVSLVMSGPANAATWLALSPIQSPVFVASCNGVLHGDLGTSAILFVGFLSGGGQLTLSMPVPALGLLGAVVHAQMGMVVPAGCYLGAPTAIAIVDPRY